MANLTPLIILGSCRPESDTKLYVSFVFKGSDYKVVDSLSYEIAPYSYDGVYPSTDNFIQLVETMLTHEIHWVLFPFFPNINPSSYQQNKYRNKDYYLIIWWVRRFPINLNSIRNLGLIHLE